jgi:hypothetical protein
MGELYRICENYRGALEAGGCVATRETVAARETGENLEFAV